MVPWLFLAVGLAVGTALGAGILRARSSSRLAVSEAAAGELRRQLEQIGAESSDLKAKLEEEQRARVQAETLLQSEREKLEEEQNQFDEARARLSETFQGLAGEAAQKQQPSFPGAGDSDSGDAARSRRWGPRSAQGGHPSSGHSSLRIPQDL